MGLWDELPASLVEVAEEIGLVNALALAAIYGGRDLWIRPHFPDDHLVVLVLGREVSDRLSARFGGGVLYLSKAFQLKLEERDEEICAARETTKISDLAKKYGLTERRILSILRKKKRQPTHEQLNLLDG